jgi:hypothetical protein
MPEEEAQHRVNVHSENFSQELAEKYMAHYPDFIWDEVTGPKPSQDELDKAKLVSLFSNYDSMYV